MPKLWWWEEYLAEDLFVVVEQIGVVVGALFAWADDSPVAWVRVGGRYPPAKMARRITAPPAGRSMKSVETLSMITAMAP